jgi:seryl-tRNA synthetase
MDVSINLLPIVLSKLGWDKYDSECIALNACFKLWSCKMFRERISMASQVKHLQAANEQLLDENNSLKEQIAKLLAANGKPNSTKNANLTYVSASIGARVKERNAHRKRGRNVSY